MNQRNNRFVTPDIMVQPNSRSSTGLHRSFVALLDTVVEDVNDGVNIVTEYPGFYRAMLDNQTLFGLFLKRIKSDKKKV